MPTLDDARSWYPADDPVHGFDHVVRVYRLAGRLARAEGADVEIVRAAALLHDVDSHQQSGGDDPSTKSGAHRETHHHAAAEFARQVLVGEGWPQERIQAVEHCIRAHRFRDESQQPQTLEAKVLFDADKLDAIGAIGAARAIAYAVAAGQPLFAQPSQKFLHTGQKETGESHTPLHEHLFKLKKIKERMFTPAGKALAEGRHRFLEAFFQQWEAELSGER